MLQNANVGYKTSGFEQGLQIWLTCLVDLAANARHPSTICPASNTEIPCSFALQMYLTATASYLSRCAGCDLCLFVQRSPVNLLQALTHNLISQACLLLIWRPGALLLLPCCAV